MRNTIKAYRDAADSMETVDAGLGQDLRLAAADLEDLSVALKTIAEFPVTDATNMDAVNMQKIALQALTN